MKLHLHQQLLNHAVLINSTAACMYYAKKRLKKIKKKVPSSRTGCPTRPRTRKSVKALEELDDGDTSSKKYLRLSRRRNETDLKLQNLRKETEQFD